MSPRVRNTLISLTIFIVLILVFILQSRSTAHDEVKTSVSAERTKPTEQHSPDVHSPEPAETRPDATPSAITAIRKLRDSGNFKDAEAALIELLAKNPDDTLALRELLIIYHTGAPNLGEALNLEEKLLKQEASNEAEFERYREIAQLAKKEDRAVEFLNQLEPAAQNIAFVIPKTAGQLLESTGDYKKAIEKYREALNYPNERSALVYEHLASAQIKARHYADAQLSLEKAIEDANQYNTVDGREVKMEISTRNAEFQLLDVYLNRGQYQKVLDQANQLLKTDHQNKDLQRFVEMAKMGLNRGKLPRN
ncbi:MAG: hypothetical protein EOP10_19890 [Proteobacteria bacterium]|nr:MAG: hypothetical protein EOP10_19890 [Pseudomonadota bacterium]